MKVKVIKQSFVVSFEMINFTHQTQLLSLVYNILAQDGFI